MGASKEIIKTFRDLRVYQAATHSAMEIFHLSRTFPLEERFSLTDQVRKSSRSVCANLAEAWRKRRYSAAFISKLSDSESEAAETQVWLEFAFRCGYMTEQNFEELNEGYEHVLSQVVRMIADADKWTIKHRPT
jgi:four helix bundle protein